jgi:periplasmic protein CpxP/Spy
MNKIKLYKIVILALIICNGILLYFLMSKPKHFGGPKNIIIEKLHFDTEQIKQYDAIIATHRIAIDENNVSMLQLRNRMYNQLLLPNDSNTLDSISNEIALVQKKLELIHFQHFKEIQKICKPQQQADFKNVVGELSTLFNKQKIGIGDRK